MADSTKIKGIFEKIAPYYDLMNNFISLNLHYPIKKISLKDLNIKPNSYVLDLCCGTGDFSKIISGISPKSKVIGFDISKNMLRLAKIKNPNGVFIEGDCTNLPFCSEFDYITMGFGLRNIENRSAVLSEIHKSLKNGGKFLHLDFGKHNKMSILFDYFVKVIIKITNKDTESYLHLINSKNTYPEPEELIKEFEQAGFELLKRKDFLFGVISYQIMEKI